MSSLPHCNQCTDKNVPAVHSFLVAITGEGEEILVDLCNDCGEEWRTIPQEVRDCKDCKSCFDCHCLERRDVSGRN